MNQRWRACSKTPPPLNTSVLCCNVQRGTMFFGSYIGGHFSDDVYAFKVEGACYAKGATHWQPKPALPDPISHERNNENEHEYL